MSNAETASEGALTIDAAAGLIFEDEGAEAPAEDTGQDEEPDPDTDDEADEDQAPEGDDPDDSEEESEADPEAEDAEDPEEAIDGEDAEPEGDPEEAIAAPLSWDAPSRAKFATLPRDVQEIITARETERDRAVSRAQQEASEARRQSEAELSAELSKIAAMKPVLDEVATRAKEVFASQWDQVDWEAMAQDPQVYAINQARYAKYQAEVKRVEEARQKAAEAETRAQDQQFQTWLRAESEKLPQIVPELADPQKGPQEMARLSQFLRDQGATDKQLKGISAAEISIAYDAMRFREGRAAFKATSASPKNAPKKPPAKTVSPSAAVSRPAPLKKQAQAASDRFRKTGSFEDAVALLDAKG